MERWRAAEGFEGFYEVSDLGNVRRIAAGQGTRTGLVKLQKNQDGYIHNRLCMNGKCRTVAIHRLVVKAFIGPIPEKGCVNHLDGNTSNNRIDNLEITTNAGNIQHAVKYLGYRGTSHPGMKNPIAKLTDDQVLEMRAAPIKRGTATAFAKKFGISIALADKIIKGKAWKHLL
jgi:hypothetical protein